MPTIVDVDLITDDDGFDEWLGGQVHSEDMRLAPDSWEGSSKPARQYALDRILEALRRRTPPIRWGDLEDKSELRLAVYYGAAEHMYQLAMSTGATPDVYEKHREMWEKKFDNEVSGLTPSLIGGLRGTANSFGISRR